MGCGSIFSYYYGKKDDGKMQESMFTSFLFVGVIAIVMNVTVFAGIDVILKMLQIPADIYGIMKEYTWVVFWGIFFVFLYFFCISSPGSGKFPDSVIVPWRGICLKYCAGFTLCCEL